MFILYDEFVICLVMGLWYKKIAKAAWINANESEIQVAVLNNFWTYKML